MKQDDLTQVKNIGPSRMKLLNDSGITTIKQLDETPLEKLAQIESIGFRYEKLIKDAVTEYYGKKPEKLTVTRSNPMEARSYAPGCRWLRSITDCENIGVL